MKLDWRMHWNELRLVENTRSDITNFWNEHWHACMLFETTGDDWMCNMNLPE
jgi:hypothetical protein